MKTQNNILKKLIAALLSTAVILGASSVSGIPVGTSAVAEPAEDSGIITGGKDDANANGYHWKYITGKNPDYNSETDPPYNEYTWADSETTWSYDPNTKTLTIGGTGPMPDWKGEGDLDGMLSFHYFQRPWGSRGKIGEIEDARKNIEHIVIEEGVTSIGSYAFCNFKTVDTELAIDIPDSVKTIKKNAFYWTTRLKSIIIPDSVTDIEPEVFWHAENLETIKLPSQLKTLGYSAFQSCISLKSITIPETVTRIENNTFRYCHSLTNVEIPPKVTLLGNGAFRECNNLNTVTFKGTETIPALGNDVFRSSPCAAEGVKGLIIESCAVLDAYIAKFITNSNNKNNNNYYTENIDKTHNIYYTAEGAVITEKCTNDPGCHHTATATLSIPDNKTWFFYDDGNEIKPVINTIQR